jgi:peptide deformylase
MNDLTGSRPVLISRAMAIRPLVTLPDPRLRLKSVPVDKIDAEVRRLSQDMLDTMYDAPGVGLAAIQIGEPRRIVTIDTSKKDEERRPVVLVNPEIVWASEEKSTYEEGCLSIPEYYEEVERPARIKFRYTDLDGKAVEVEAEGLLARCLLHELDHLDGRLFVDHLSMLKKKSALARWERERAKYPALRRTVVAARDLAGQHNDEAL